MSDTVLKGGLVINRGQSFYSDIHIKEGRIHRIAPSIEVAGATEVDATGKWIMPGVIDDQVHFREPGLTYKADIASESRAAIAGGVTSFMEMPNTKPATLTQELLQDKYDIAAQSAYCNYSFFMGASNDNLEEVLKTDPRTVCGIKAFMGSSTGNMLVDDPVTLDKLFSSVDMLIATHCEDEHTVRANMQAYKEKYGDSIDPRMHADIRSVEGCYLSSSFAVELAKKHNTRLHILHISTAKELELFTNDRPMQNKRITSEVCVHHLSFNADDYEVKGNDIKCNPAIKAIENQEALWVALLDDRLDIIATDHAPHTREEKDNNYWQAPSGLPLVQHSLNLMLNHVKAGRITKERMVEKMCHSPAECFQIIDRGYLQEGYFADIVVVDPSHNWQVERSNVLYKSGWSPLEGHTMYGAVMHTYVNGVKVYDRGGNTFTQSQGERLLFDRK